MRKISKVRQLLAFLVATVVVTTSACSVSVDAATLTPVERMSARAIDLTVEFAKEELDSVPPVSRWEFIPASSYPEVRGCKAVVDNASYCNDGIYLNETFMNGAYSKAGSAGVYVIVGHEFGHHAQNHLGIAWLSSVDKENQADCVSGAFLAFASQRGEAQNIRDPNMNLDPLIASIASPDDPFRDHGTFKERKAAIQQGIENGVASCFM